jgi:hypothetical protein
MLKKCNPTIKKMQISLKRDSRYESWRRQFGLFSDSQRVIRCGGRISNAEIQYETKHPIMLDRNHRVTRLIIEAGRYKTRAGKRANK